MEPNINMARVPMARRGYTYPADEQSPPQRTSRFAEYFENAKRVNQHVTDSQEYNMLNRTHSLIPRESDFSDRSHQQNFLNHEVMSQQLQPRAPYGRPIPPPPPTSHCLAVPQPMPSLLLRPLLPPPTIHLVSFSHNHVLHYSNFSSLLSDIVPVPSTHLYTIRAGLFEKPPKHLWQDFTGTHPVIQDHVMRDPLAREAVNIAVRDLRRAVEGKMGCHVVLSVSCGAGTHRSVAVVEKIREYLDRWNTGILVRVVHVHRSKRERDPW